MDARDSPMREKYAAAQHDFGTDGTTPPKLRRVRRLDCIRLDTKDTTYFTKEGYLVDHPVLTSCGIFEYANPDGSTRRELRLPEHVFAPESLKSYRGKPIIITHDAGAVDKDNVDREQIGTILSDGYPDGENVRAEIIIHNTDAMKDCGLRELSLGYNLELLEEPGVWNGEPYDAVQTNIVINHLALVASARAGEQARLNIDGSDEPELRGGKKPMNEETKTNQDTDLTPEQLEEAIALWKAKNAADGADCAPAALPSVDSDEEPVQDSDGALPVGNAVPDKPAGSSIEEKLAAVKGRRDRRNADGAPGDLDGAKGVIAQQDEDIDTLTACLETLLAEKAAKKDGADCTQQDCGIQTGPGGNQDCGDTDCKDGSDDQSQSMNADSADAIIRQRLSICRIGDKLHLDGLEDKSILDGKKAIIAKVLPGLRLDGKSKAYVDACYDLAVNRVSERKDAEYQRQQMSGGRVRTDSRSGGNHNGMTMAASARQRMLDREGGNR